MTFITGIAMEVTLLSTQSDMGSPQVKREWGCSYTSTVSIILISIIQIGASKKSCRVYSGLGEPCIFPYILNGEFYSECSTDFDKESTNAMCPIRLANDITLETSKDPQDWGHCAKDCDRNTKQMRRHLMTL